MKANYYDAARQNEEVFRNVLRDLKTNRDKRPMGCYIPENLESELSLDEIFRMYSEGNRIGQFTITTFARLSRDVATIGFRDVAPLSGCGAELEYLVKEDNSVEYRRPVLTMMS